MTAELQCWNCAASLAELPRPITRHMNCPKCFEDLHCCRMCRHFLVDAASPCADERAEPPVYKEGANFCDFFRPSSVGYRDGANERRAQARSNLAALFAGEEDAETDAEAEADAETGDAVGSPAETAARQKLDDLFR